MSFLKQLLEGIKERHSACPAIRSLVGAILKKLVEVEMKARLELMRLECYWSGCAQWCLLVKSWNLGGRERQEYGEFEASLGYIENSLLACGLYRAPFLKKFNNQDETVFWFAFYYCNKYHDHNTVWGRKGLFSLHFQITVHSWEKSDRNSRQAPGACNWGRNAASWLASRGLLCLLSLPPVQALPCLQWGVEGGSLKEAFSQVRFPFPRWP